MEKDRTAESIDEIKSEQEDYYSDDDLYNINSWGADLSFRELVERYKNGEIIKPEMQRHYVWDKTEASRFIDSILLGLPVPSIFLAKPSQRDEDLLIVDGYQRIMTVHDFLEGIFQTDNKVFKLTNSKKINARWRGKAFKELEENEQRKIRNTTIHSIIFVQVTPKSDTGMYQIFERINTSGRTLFPQEIRNCVYQGPLNKLLIELNGNKTWRILFGLETPDNRMRDLEFILRYFAISNTEWDENDDGAISLKKFLNDFMGKYQSSNSHSAFMEELEADFKQTIEFVRDNFGDDAFQNISLTSKKPTGKFNPTIFDSLMTASKKAIICRNKFNVEALRANRQQLLADPDYQDLIKVRTTNKDRIAKRIQMVMDQIFQMEYE